MKSIKIILAISACVFCHTAFSQTANKEADSTWRKSISKIEGEGRTCNMINSFTGDLNHDGTNDLLVYYSCDIKGSIGKGTTGGGWAIWLNKNGVLQFLLNDEKKFGLAPLEILKDCSINCNQLQYDSDSGKPSVIGQRKVMLDGNSLVILK
jgi:hypothetical protein